MAIYAVLKAFFRYPAKLIMVEQNKLVMSLSKLSVNDRKTAGEWLRLSFSEREYLCKYEPLSEGFIRWQIAVDPESFWLFLFELILASQKLSLGFIEEYIERISQVFDKWDQNGWTILSYGPSDLPYEFIKEHEDKLWLESKKIVAVMDERFRLVMMVLLKILPGPAVSAITTYYI